MQIDRHVPTHKSHLFVDGACPVNLIESCVQVLQHEEKEVLIIAVEPFQFQQNVKISIGEPSVAFTHLRYLSVIDDVLGLVGIPLVVLVNHDGTVYPYGELIEEILFF